MLLPNDEESPLAVQWPWTDGGCGIATRCGRRHNKVSLVPAVWAADQFATLSAASREGFCCSGAEDEERQGISRQLGAQYQCPFVAYGRRGAPRRSEP